MTKIDTADLLDAHEVAALLGQKNHRAVSVLRQRNEDFPAPAVVKRGLLLWLRQDVERWARDRERAAPAPRRRNT